jgi:hypothetical protein
MVLHLVLLLIVLLVVLVLPSSMPHTLWLSRAATARAILTMQWFSKVVTDQDASSQQLFAAAQVQEQGVI